MQHVRIYEPVRCDGRRPAQGSSDEVPKGLPFRCSHAHESISPHGQGPRRRPDSADQLAGRDRCRAIHAGAGDGQPSASPRTSTKGPCSVGVLAEAVGMGTTGHLPSAARPARPSSCRWYPFRSQHCVRVARPSRFDPATATLTLTTTMPTSSTTTTMPTSTAPHTAIPMSTRKASKRSTTTSSVPLGGCPVPTRSP